MTETSTTATHPHAAPHGPSRWEARVTLECTDSTGTRTRSELVGNRWVRKDQALAEARTLAAAWLAAR
jgi:hypothetical protein